METFSSVHLDRAVTENTGKFSLLLNNIKQFDKIVKILKEGGEVTFTVWMQLSQYVIIIWFVTTNIYFPIKLIPCELRDSAF